MKPTLCNVLTLTITINLVSPGNARTGGFCSLTPTLFQKLPSLQTQKLENCFVFCFVIGHLLISILNNFNPFYLFDSFPSNKLTLQTNSLKYSSLNLILFYSDTVHYICTYVRYMYLHHKQ